ncbi:sensor histidine kinase [Silicimonas algicola]|uniref:histidine kinase n=1 Tax=Silicimonas algicola TaxID=1826607 RepID=A0A316GBM6_9RHOB|nr:sensor histidine kinase [Silicimonas algicola]PWK57060.1 two-component sensor histidine kinase [Silicimonas algicola]
MKAGILRFLSRRTLAVRLLALLTLALLPLGLIAVFQTFSVVREARVLSERDILVQTADAANEEVALMQRALGAAQGLAAALATIDPSAPICSDILARFDERSPSILSLYIRPDGSVICASDRQEHNLADSAIIDKFFERPVPTVTVTRKGRVTGQSVMVTLEPIRDPQGGLLGALSISIPHSLADTLLANQINDMELAIVDRTGLILSASTGIENVADFEALGVVPENITIGRLGTAHRVTVAPGREMLIAIVPLLHGDLYAVGRWIEGRAPASMIGAATPAFPVLMWLAGLFVAFFAMDRLVLRHLKVLRGRMARYSPERPQNGHAILDNAPPEVAEIADSYNGMIDRIAANHAALAANVREKEVLLKEIHHRVKNNLQLIASILNMQIRSIESPQARSVLRRVQDRVMSLALIHKSLYADTQVDVVRADPLIDEIIRSIVSGIPSTPLCEVDVSLGPVELDPDQAVPLSLLVTEAVTNAAKYAGDGREGNCFIRIEMHEPDPRHVSLTISNSRGVRQPTAGDAETGLGSRLIYAFVSQLGGEIHISEGENEYVIQVEFPKLEPATPLHQAAE